MHAHVRAYMRAVSTVLFLKWLKLPLLFNLVLTLGDYFWS